MVMHLDFDVIRTKALDKVDHYLDIHFIFTQNKISVSITKETTECLC